MMTINPIMDYAKQLALQQAVSGNTTPSATSLDVLSSLKLLQAVGTMAESGSAFAPVAEAELRYMQAATNLLKKNSTLRDRFGMDVQAVTNVSALLKQRHSEVLYNAMLDNGIMNDVSLKAQTEFTEKRAGVNFN